MPNIRIEMNENAGRENTLTVKVDLPFDIEKFKEVLDVCERASCICRDIMQVCDSNWGGRNFFAIQHEIFTLVFKEQIVGKLIKHAGRIGEEFLSNAGNLPKNLPQDIENRYFNLIDDFYAISEQYVQSEIYVTASGDIENLQEVCEPLVNTIHTELELAQAELADKHGWKRGQTRCCDEMGYNPPRNIAKFTPVHDPKHPLERPTPRRDKANFPKDDFHETDFGSDIFDLR